MAGHHDKGRDVLKFMVAAHRCRAAAAEEVVPAAPLLRPPADVDAVSAGALPGSELGIRPHSRACRIQKAAVLGDASAFRSCVAARGTTTWKDVRTAS
ncbi:hypothetical protein CWO91_28365 [Bradyrhizobium genosp. SA-3]|uniref:hypothetical protein n=1 Tax=Bradyrhizobium genosp. SA-3 TaxID=508868 RepID=UPI0010290E30|nr:hypothetical protein [Bradyrhizobium genosp. SA-3]RZN07167.1 hypothetical protein CWO91_28365 [Bradyrhizobium genosp. SA-3]